MTGPRSLPRPRRLGPMVALVLLAHAPPSACFACCFSLPRRCPGVTRSTSVLLGRGGSMLRRPGWFRDLLLWCGSVDCARLAPAAVLCRPALCWTAALPLRCPAGWSGRGLRSLFTSVRICHPGEDWTARPRIPSPCRCVPGGRAHPAPAAALQGLPRRASTSPRRVGGRLLRQEGDRVGHPSPRALHRLALGPSLHPGVLRATSMLLDGLATAA